MGPADAQTVHAKLEIHAIAGTTAASSNHLDGGEQKDDRGDRGRRE
jgi:hypothetical protein